MQFGSEDIRNYIDFLKTDVGITDQEHLVAAIQPLLKDVGTLPIGSAKRVSLEVIMNNKGVGAVFCLIASVLFAARYLSAAVFMSSVTSWDSDLFRAGLSYTGPSLLIAAIIALVVGAVFIGTGICQDFKGSTKK